MYCPDTFTAIDFETAHPQRWSICAVGLVRVEHGQIVQEIEQLIQPPNNYYWDRFSGIHGICAGDTVNAPTFAEAWPTLAPFILGQDVVAHNGLSFDFPVLRKTLAYYHLLEPVFNPHCTYRLYRKGLAQCCREHAISLNHHNAASDARACAELFLRRLALETSPVNRPSSE